MLTYNLFCIDLESGRIIWKRAAKAKGLFAGIAIDGSRLAPNQKSIANYYGKRIWPEDILFAHEVPRLPAEAQMLMKALP